MAAYLQHLTDYPKTIRITQQIGKEGTLFPRPIFAPPIEFTTVCDHDKYLSGLFHTFDLILSWYEFEIQLSGELKSEFPENYWIKYLSTLDMGSLFTEVGLESFYQTINRESQDNILNRFVDLHATLRATTDPAALVAIQGRMMYTLLVHDIEIASLPQFKYDAKSGVMLVVSKAVDDLVRTCPWIWLIPLYMNYRTYQTIFASKERARLSSPQS